MWYSTCRLSTAFLCQNAKTVTNMILIVAFCEKAWYNESDKVELGDINLFGVYYY